MREERKKKADQETKLARKEGMVDGRKWREKRRGGGVEGGGGRKERL